MFLTPLLTFQKFQLLTASLILWGCVQLRPKTDRNMCQRSAATGQCKKRRLIDFKSSTHNIYSQATIFFYIDWLESWWPLLVLSKLNNLPLGVILFSKLTSRPYINSFIPWAHLVIACLYTVCTLLRTAPSPSVRALAINCTTVWSSQQIKYII